MAAIEPSRSDVFDVDKILKLIELMKEHDLTEIDLRQSDQEIRLKRGPEPQVAGYAAAAGVPAASVPPPLPAAATTDAEPEEEVERDESNIVTIKSPMVGTFYSKANPDTDPYVKVGDHVMAETTICIIEAMKVFNEINADVSGQIVAILVENEDPVEYGKPLFKVDTSK